VHLKAAEATMKADREEAVRKPSTTKLPTSSAGGGIADRTPPKRVRHRSAGPRSRGLASPCWLYYFHGRMMMKHGRIQVGAQRSPRSVAGVDADRAARNPDRCGPAASRFTLGRPESTLAGQGHCDRVPGSTAGGRVERIPAVHRTESPVYPRASHTPKVRPTAVAR